MDTKRGKRAGSEYDAVSFKVHWPALSLVAFALTLPFDYFHLWIWPDRIAYIVGGLTAAGFLAGLIGCADINRRRWAALGAFLNGLSLGLQAVIEWIYATY